MKGQLPSLPTNFADPLTGYRPTGEEQMSCLLGLFHQMNRVDWSRVPLLSPRDRSTALNAHEALGESLVCGEYRLFSNSEEERSIWGSMPADLIFLSKDERKVALIENKIGSGFTGTGPDPATGQLAKQAEFLLRCRIPKRFLILLSSKEWFTKGWYLNELSSTLQHNQRNKLIAGYLMQWEDVFAALV